MYTFDYNRHHWIRSGCRATDENRMPSARQLVFEIDRPDGLASRLIHPILNEQNPFTTAITVMKAVVNDTVNVHHRQIVSLSERTDGGLPR